MACGPRVGAAVVAAQRWTFNRSTTQTLAIPRPIRALPGFGDLEYDDTSRVLGLQIDLNRDGHADYIIRSAESLCGNGDARTSSSMARLGANWERGQWELRAASSARCDVNLQKTLS